jgi:hypothetical protein
MRTLTWPPDRASLTQESTFVGPPVYLDSQQGSRLSMDLKQAFVDKYAEVSLLAITQQLTRLTALVLSSELFAHNAFHRASMTLIRAVYNYRKRVIVSNQAFA